MGNNIVDDYAKKTEVYYEMGKFRDNTPKFLKAPFDLIQMPSTPGEIIGFYVQPTPVFSDATDGAGILSEDTLTNQVYQGRGSWGYSTLNHVMVSENEMGDLSDTWKGLHRFDTV